MIGNRHDRKLSQAAQFLRCALMSLSALALLLPTAPASSQQRDASKSANAATSAQDDRSTSRDIIVQAIRRQQRDINRILVPVPSIVGFKRLREHAEFFSHCVHDPDLALLHAMIDGSPNSPASKMALDQIIRSHKTCYPGYPAFAPNPPYFGECNPRRVEDTFDTMFPALLSCAAVYDRGALMEAAIHRYAPHFSLTDENVNDPAVQARLDAKEVPRNRYRLPADRVYFEAAICMVRLQPELATDLVRNYGDAHFQAHIGQLILVRAKRCVGNPKHIKVEPGQFAIYIADAAYRWEVAARGVDSLLPASTDGQ